MQELKNHIFKLFMALTQMTPRDFLRKMPVLIMHVIWDMNESLRFLQKNNGCICNALDIFTSWVFPYWSILLPTWTGLVLITSNLQSWRFDCFSIGHQWYTNSIIIYGNVQEISLKKACFGHSCDLKHEFWSQVSSKNWMMHL